MPFQQQTYGHFDYSVNGQNMNCQQPYIMDYPRRFGPDFSPHSQQMCPNQTLDNRPRNPNNMNLVYDMDSGEVKTDRRPDPLSSTILARLDMISAELSLTVKTADISDIARKEDLKQMQDLIDGHTSELQEMRKSLDSHTKQLSDLTELVNRNSASVVNIGQETADIRSRLVSKQSGSNMASSNEPPADTRSTGMSPRRLNLILEGVPLNADLHLFVISLAEELGMTIYKRDITIAVRLRRRDSRDKRPGPVLVGFYHIYPRDNILKKRGSLKGSMQFGDVWVNADETMEVRKLKSEFRRIAYHARLVGEEVHFNHESIRIGEDLFFADDTSNLREKYKVGQGNNEHQPHVEKSNPPFQFRVYQNQIPDPTTREPLERRENQDRSRRRAAQPNLEQDTSHQEAATNLDARRTVPIYSLYPPTDESVKIKLTDSGLCFSGYTAFISNHYERPFTFEDIEHRTVDHGYCFKKAICYDRPDLADKVKHTIGPIEAKDHVRNLGPNPKWDRIKVPTLKALFVAKLTEHPDLLDALLKTAPHRLIEASWDSLWGGGAPFGSPKYDDKTWDGFNQFGDMATAYRDEIIEKRKAHTV